MQSFFTTADKNKNNLLTSDEFTEFFTMILNSGESRGNFEDRRPNTAAKAFELSDRVNLLNKGVALDDFLKFMDL